MQRKQNNTEEPIQDVIKTVDPEDHTYFQKCYEWEHKNYRHGLRLTINKNKQFIMHLQSMNDMYEITENRFDEWLMYGNNVDHIKLAKIYNYCSYSILNTVAYDLLINCAPDDKSLKLIKRFRESSVVWLICNYDTCIEIFLFFPNIGIDFTPYIFGYEETNNHYDDQMHRLKERAEISDVYKWALTESSKYLRPIITNELQETFELIEKMIPQPLVGEIVGYLIPILKS